MAQNFGLDLESLPQHLLLKPREAAQYCRVDTAQLKKWRRAGELAYVSLGERTIRYRVSDLLAYLSGRAK